MSETDDKTPLNQDGVELKFSSQPSQGKKISHGGMDASDESINPLVEKPPPLAKEFHPSKQLRKLMLTGLARWLVTVVIISCLYSILIGFSSQLLISRTGKRIFNTLITGFSIALGLNVVSSLKAMALELRWWILTWRMWTIQELDLILHAESLAHLVKLGITSSHIGVRLSVVLWLLFNAAAQIGVAMIGLTYSVDTAEGRAFVEDGLVAVPNMTSIQTASVVKSKERGLGALEYTTNSFGIIALSLSTSDIENLPQQGNVLLSGKSNLLFSGEGYWKYVFYETPAERYLSPGQGQEPSLSIATDRSVNSSAVCRSWPVIQGGNGTELNITVNMGVESTPSTIPIPIVGGVDQTTFMTLVNGSAACGPGCSRVTAFEASTTAPWYYDCNVTVGDVANSSRSEHQIGPVLRRLSSSAIALQGYAASSLVKDPAVQYQVYPAESVFGLPTNGSSADMAMIMARFAIGVIAVAGANNDILIIPGRSPRSGLTLNVSDWKDVHMILCMTGGIQLVLVIVVSFIANRVIVRDNSPLATARLLRPIVECLGRSGSTASGDEIAKELSKDFKLVYCVDSSEKPGYHQVQLSEGKASRPFPKGWYD